jgi:putative ABC transport system substrate-binding protein
MSLFRGPRRNDLYRMADGHAERLPALAADLVRQRPATIIAPQGNSALAAKAATGDIPIIFVVGNDPVELALVASLNHPGGNLTGIVLFGAELAAKRVEFLHSAVPAVETIALLVGSADNPLNQAEVTRAQSTARTFGLRLVVFNLTTDAEIAPVFATLVEHGAGAILVGVSSIVVAKLDQTLTLAARFAQRCFSQYVGP